ncbi:hypothetical protein DFH06DRAFT_1130264 [Mycena polygramma]|nr:hypothetical protein DFH06DRAFT_1130264 [Mycena polygramma]
MFFVDLKPLSPLRTQQFQATMILFRDLLQSDPPQELQVIPAPRFYPRKSVLALQYLQVLKFGVRTPPNAEPNRFEPEPSGSGFGKKYPEPEPNRTCPSLADTSDQGAAHLTASKNLESPLGSPNAVEERAIDIVKQEQKTFGDAPLPATGPSIAKDIRNERDAVELGAWRPSPTAAPSRRRAEPGANSSPAARQAELRAAQDVLEKAGTRNPKTSTLKRPRRASTHLGARGTADERMGVAV